MASPFLLPCHVSGSCSKSVLPFIVDAMIVSFHIECGWGSGEEEEWENILRKGLDHGGGSVSGVELLSALDLRMERTLMRTVNDVVAQKQEQMSP